MLLHANETNKSLIYPLHTIHAQLCSKMLLKFPSNMEPTKDLSSRAHQNLSSVFCKNCIFRGRSSSCPHGFLETFKLITLLCYEENILPLPGLREIKQSTAGESANHTEAIYQKLSVAILIR